MFDKTNNQEHVRFTLRINKSLFETVKQNAFHNRRAIGKEMEYSLFRYYENLGLIKQD